MKGEGADKSVLETATTEEPKAEGSSEKAEGGALELKVPDGFKVEESALKGFKELAAKTGLKPEQAQAAFDHYVGIEQARAKADAEWYQKRDREWLEAIGKEFGEPTSKQWQSHLGELKRAAKFLGADVAKELTAAGLGNNPTLVRALVKLGRALGEDRIAGTSDAPGVRAPKSFVELAYPTMQSNKE